MAFLTLPNGDHLRVERTEERKFPYRDAVIMEDCCWRDPYEMRADLVEYQSLFLLAKLTRRRVGEFVDMDYLVSHIAEPPSSAPVKSEVVGFLIGSIEPIDGGQGRCSGLIDLAASYAEDERDFIADALIAQWQDACRRSLWRDLRVDVWQEQEEDPIFRRNKFARVESGDSCLPDALVWVPENAMTATGS